MLKTKCKKSSSQISVAGVQQCPVGRFTQNVDQSQLYEEACAQVGWQDQSPEATFPVAYDRQGCVAGEIDESDFIHQHRGAWLARLMDRTSFTSTGVRGWRDE